MYFLTASTHTLFEVFQPAIDRLDACWWWLDNHGYDLNRHVEERLIRQGVPAIEHQQTWNGWHDQFVVSSTVGKPGFFSRLGDSINMPWGTIYAIEGENKPSHTLRILEEELGIWSPTLTLPQDIVLVIQDVDHAWQQYAFRDVTLLEIVKKHLDRTSISYETQEEWIRL